MIQLFPYETIKHHKKGFHMKYSEAKQGRTFVIRLEDGEILHEAIETFCRDRHIGAASLIALGGADKESRIVVGPEDGRADTIKPLVHQLDDVHELMGTGTVFPDKDGTPMLHMHMAGGRNGKAVAGCVRAGVKVWHVMEVILTELTGSDASRLLDKQTGFELLNP